MRAPQVNTWLIMSICQNHEAGKSGDNNVIIDSHNKRTSVMNIPDSQERAVLVDKENVTDRGGRTSIGPLTATVPVSLGDQL